MDEEIEMIQTPEGEFFPGKPQYAGGCFGFDVIPRDGHGPLVQMYVEDDGLWHRRSSFDIAWADDFIDQLTKIKKDYA